MNPPKDLVRTIGLYVFDSGGTPLCTARSAEDAKRIAEAINSKGWELAFLEASQEREKELSALRASHAELVEIAQLARDRMAGGNTWMSCQITDGEFLSKIRDVLFRAESLSQPTKIP